MITPPHSVAEMTTAYGEAGARQAPHDLEAEQALLGALMLDKDALAAVRDQVESGDFYADKHGHIYSAACALYERGDPIEPLTLRAELERLGVLSRSGGVGYLSDLPGHTPSAVSVKYYADTVVAHSLRRRLIRAGAEVAQLGYDPALPVDEALDQAEQRVFGLGNQRRTTDAQHIAPILQQTWADLEERLQKKQIVNGVRTNFTSLDRVTQGLQPGELVILAARPSVGKTAFALNITRNAAVLKGSEVPVAFFSLEMTADSLVQRMICSEAGVDSYLLRTGQAASRDYESIARAMDRLSRADIYIDDTPALTISALRARARRMRSQHNIGLIVVDYLQIMHGGRQESRVQEVSDISAGLKSIAKELRIPVLALSQLSRESERRENRRPQLSDLRDSGSIEQDADVVLFLYRPGMRDQEVDKSTTELIVAKNRTGPTGDFPLHFVAETTTFKEPYPGDL